MSGYVPVALEALDEGSHEKDWVANMSLLQYTGSMFCNMVVEVVSLPLYGLYIATTVHKKHRITIAHVEYYP